MTTTTDQWLDLKTHKKRRAKQVLIGSGLIALVGAAVFCLATYVASHVETQPFLYHNMSLLFASSMLFFLSGMAVMIVGVSMSAKAEIPTDIFEIPPQLRRLAVMSQQAPIRSKSMYSFWPMLWTVLALATCVVLSIFWVIYRGFPEQLFILILFFLLLVTLTISSITLIVIIVSPRHHTQVTIDRVGKAISFTDVFTKKVRVYPFAELVGFVNTYSLVSTRSGYRKKYVINLIYHGVRVEKIASDVISNIAELKIGLQSLRQIKFTDTAPIDL